MAIGTYLSLFHLGRKFLFWRALINIRNSRLSREILFFTLFGISLLLDILIEGFQSHWHLLTIVPLLFSVDQLYKNLQEQWKIFLHPDQVFLISLSLSLFLLDIKLVLLFVLTFRLLLAFFHLFFQEKKPALVQNLFYFRIILLISCLFFIGISQNPKMTFYLFCLSEILGRILFYKHLSIPNVENKMKKLVGL